MTIDDLNEHDIVDAGSVNAGELAVAKATLGLIKNLLSTEGIDGRQLVLAVYGLTDAESEDECDSLTKTLWSRIITRIKKIDQELAGVSFSVRKVSPSQLKQFREESLRTVTDDDLKDMDVTRYMRKNGILISGSWEDAGDKFVLQLMADWLVKQESSIEVLGAERVDVPKSALNERQRLCFENASREKTGAIESRLARDNVSSAGQNPIPFWSMGQMDQLISTKFQPGRGRDFIYVTNLSFMDASTRTLMAELEEQVLINNAVIDGISMAMKSNPKIKLNEPGHMIINTDSNTLKMIDIVYDPNKTPDERMDEIINAIMGPFKVDVIVSGQYLEQDEINEVILKPIAICKMDKKIIAKTMHFAKSEYICPELEPTTQKFEIPCKILHEAIMPIFNDVFIEKGADQENIYVARLSFMDAATRTVFSESEEAELINSTIDNVIQMAINQNHKIKLNNPEHMIVDTNSNILEIIDIVYDPARTPDMRMDDIMKTIMMPNKVDIIVTGQYLNIDEKNEIRLKPLAIDGRDKMIRGKTFDLKKSQCMGPKPVRHETKALCTDSHERIARAVKELLEAL